jgi:hypothetical protein
VNSRLLILLLGLGLPGVGLADGAKLVQEATTYLRERQARMNEHHGLGAYERYDWDQEARRIVFSNAADPQRLIADIVFVGSVSNRSGTWLWSWANPSVDAALSRPVRKLREFGEQRKLKKLQQAKWPGDEVDGWEMTSIAAYVLKADGAYRTADDDGFTYMLLFNVRKSRK